MDAKMKPRLCLIEIRQTAFIIQLQFGGNVRQHLPQFHEYRHGLNVVALAGAGDSTLSGLMKLVGR
jgi:hypothetical protein